MTDAPKTKVAEDFSITTDLAIFEVLVELMNILITVSKHMPIEGQAEVKPKLDKAHASTQELLAMMKTRVQNLKREQDAETMVPGAEE